jgi:hypothetical protein
VIWSLVYLARRAALSWSCSACGRRRPRRSRSWWYARPGGFFIEFASRRGHLAGATDHPTGPWVTQQARNLLASLGDQAVAWRSLIRDRDTKFTRVFDDVWRSTGAEVICTPIRAPNANAVAERWIGTVRRGCLDQLLIVSDACGGRWSAAPPRCPRWTDPRVHSMTPAFWHATGHFWRVRAVYGGTRTCSLRLGREARPVSQGATLEHRRRSSRSVV